MMRALILIAFILIGYQTAHAEMYRWVDENGKVHFSDKKPPDQKAEDISDSVKQQNTDYGGREAEKQLQQYERNRDAKNTEQKQKEQRKLKNEQRLREACRKARRDLKIIKGRVIFYDDNRREVKVTEKEREQRAKDLEAEIKKYCG